MGTPRPECPSFPHGGACLGRLNAATYTSLTLDPPVTYTVPDGWANYEDLPGHYLLVAPGSDLAGVDAGTSDYIGICPSVAASAPDCSDLPAPGVGQSAKEIAAWLVQQPDLETTDPRAIEVGGLSGVVLDISLAEEATESTNECGFVGALLIVGVGRTELSHAVVPGFKIRLYLLELSPDDPALAIEVDDRSGGSNLEEYSAVVRTFRFHIDEP